MAIELITCGSCGARNASHRTTCLSCGGSLAASEKSPLPRETQFTSEPAAEPLLERVGRYVKNLTIEQATKLAIISSVLLVGFSVFYYYVIFLPKVEKARADRKTQQTSTQKDNDKAGEARAEKSVSESTATTEELGKSEVSIRRSYKTIADVNVHKWPVSNSDIVAKIPKDTAVYVVGQRGDWLEVQSKHGNLPGYIEKRYAQPFEGQAERAILSRCLAQADAAYLANWNRTCAIQGREARCTLLAPVAANLNQNHIAARDECYRLHPQR